MGSTALERLVTRFEGLIRSAARAQGIAESDVDEIVQDVRVRLWKTGASDENLDTLNASYVRRVAVTAAVDMLRRQRARREDSLDDMTMTGATQSALQVPSPDRADDAELARHFELALAHMARNRRLVVQLHLEGYPRDEIVTLTGWSEPKVRNLLYRGLEELRARLREMDSTETLASGNTPHDGRTS